MICSMFGSWFGGQPKHGNFAHFPFEYSQPLGPVGLNQKCSTWNILCRKTISAGKITNCSARNNLARKTRRNVRIVSRETISLDLAPLRKFSGPAQELRANFAERHHVR